MTITPLRDDLMVQQQISGAWQHMVGVIMLNLTSRKPVKSILPVFLSKWPDPATFLKYASEKDVKDVIWSLGMVNVRYNRLVRMSWDFLSWDGNDASELYGIGRYGSESYRIFFKNEVFEPQDKELKKYIKSLEEKQCLSH